MRVKNNIVIKITLKSEKETINKSNFRNILCQHQRLELFYFHYDIGNNNNLAAVITCT